MTSPLVINVKSLPKYLAHVVELPLHVSTNFSISSPISVRAAEFIRRQPKASLYSSLLISFNSFHGVTYQLFVPTLKNLYPNLVVGSYLSHRMSTLSLLNRGWIGPFLSISEVTIKDLSLSTFTSLGVQLFVSSRYRKYMQTYAPQLTLSYGNTHFVSSAIFVMLVIGWNLSYTAA